MMTHSGDMQVRDVVLYWCGGGWVLERTSPADHKACNAAFGYARVEAAQCMQDLQEGDKRPQLLKGEDVGFQGKREVHHTVDMGCDGAVSRRGTQGPHGGVG